MSLCGMLFWMVLETMIQALDVAIVFAQNGIRYIQGVLGQISCVLIQSRLMYFHERL